MVPYVVVVVPIGKNMKWVNLVDWIFGDGDDDDIAHLVYIYIYINNEGDGWTSTTSFEMPKGSVKCSGGAGNTAR